MGVNGKNWQGCLDLVYDFSEDKTKILHQFCQAPLKVQRPFYPENSAICHTVILHTAGGIVGGDELLFNISLNAGSKALITTPTANKIYKTNGEEARQKVNIKLAENTCLEWFPQETIIFNNSLFLAETQIELGKNSHLFLWEINRWGRTHRGEKFLEGKWRSYLEVYQQGKPLWIDRQFLEGSERMYRSPLALGGQSVLGTFLYLGQSIPSEMLTKIRTLETSENLSKHDRIRGITRLPQGLIGRYRGNSTNETRTWFIKIWEILRQEILGTPAHLSRIWPS